MAQYQAEAYVNGEWKPIGRREDHKAAADATANRYAETTRLLVRVNTIVGDRVTVGLSWVAQ